MTRLLQEEKEEEEEEEMTEEGRGTGNHQEAMVGRSHLLLMWPHTPSHVVIPRGSRRVHDGEEEPGGGRVVDEGAGRERGPPEYPT